ncbi:MAG: DUF2922 domain-containing protein [Bacillaceae bacterium]
MATTLQLRFLNEAGKTVSFTVDNPVDPIVEEDVNSVMDTILNQNAFSTAGGKLMSKKEAVLIERNVSEITIA